VSLERRGFLKSVAGFIGWIATAPLLPSIPITTEDVSQSTMPPLRELMLIERIADGDSNLPLGSVWIWVGEFIPQGWALMDGKQNSEAIGGSGENWMKDFAPHGLGW